MEAVQTRITLEEVDKLVQEGQLIDWLSYYEGPDSDGTYSLASIIATSSFNSMPSINRPPINEVDIFCYD